jgi:hypothetical protein
VLAAVMYARYRRRLAAGWRRVYIIGAVFAFYLNGDDDRIDGAPVQGYVYVLDGTLIVKFADRPRKEFRANR